ncbi:MAG TPA: hypothetical protein ENN29_11555 [Candidatus Hydrogenedentes bacterium]|nr:hypothetical protein [Candidatus Hydrogenedentota bacterium]
MSARGRKIVAALLVVMFCYAATIGALVAVDSTRTTEGMDEILYLPNEKLLAYFTAGLNTVIADLLWLHCIQYTALENRGQRHFTWLEHMLFTATRLDPYFTEVYRYGAMFLAALRADPEASLRLAQAGIKVNPYAWQLPYEAAMVFLLNKREESDSRYFATQYLSMSAATGRAPGGVVNLAAKLQDEFDLTEFEKDLWYEMLESEDKFIRELAERKLIEIELRSVCRILNERLDMFAQRTGRRASSFEELIDAGLIAAVPEDPLGGHFFIGEDGSAYNTSLLDDMIIRAKNVLITNVKFYQERYGVWPDSLETLTDAGLLEEIPAHPWPGKQWQYDPGTGEVE